MGNIFQILIVIGVIIFAIVRQVSNSAEEAKKKSSKAAIPKRDELSPPPDPPIEKPKPKTTPSSVKQNLKQENTATSPPTPEEAGDDQEFNIHSTEEVRRGIIWSEILKRKY